MKLKAFSETIALSKEELDQALAPIRSREVKAQAEMQTCRIETDILARERRVQELCAGKSIDLPQLIEELDTLDLLEHRRDRYADVMSQLFPDTLA